MAGFLESLGAGLRHGGLALAAGSPEVFREQGRAIETRKQDERNRRDKAAEILLKAVQSGAIPPERLPELNKVMREKFGYDIPMDAFGATPEAAEKLLEYARGHTDRAKLEKAKTNMRDLWKTEQPVPGLGLPGEGLRGAPPTPIPPVALAPPLLGPVQTTAYNPVMAPAGEVTPGSLLKPPDGSELPPQGAIVPAQATAYNPNAITGMEPDMGEVVPVVPSRDLYPPPPVVSEDNESKYRQAQPILRRATYDNPDDEYKYQQEQEMLGRAAHAEILARQHEPQFAADLATPPSGRPAPVQPTYAPPVRAPGTIPPIVQTAAPVAAAPVVAPVAAAPAQEPMVPGPLPGRGPVPASLMSKWDVIVEAYQAGEPVSKEIFKELLSQMYPAKKDLLILPEGGTAINASGDVVARGAPKTSAMPSIMKLIEARDAIAAVNPKDPRVAILDAAIAKESTHAAAVKIENYGAPTTGVDAQGNPVFFQPGNQGGAPNIIQGVSPVPKEKAEKVLPTKAMTNIEGAASAAEDTERFVNTFKPEYGGHFILGKLSNTIGRTVGDDSGQAQWWQDLEAHQNVTRHELFGSALTKTELGAWNATAVNPSMNAGEIKKNLERRMVIERRAVAKLAKSYMAQGYNKEGIRELLGSMADYILDTPTPTVGKPAIKGKVGVGSAVQDMAREQQDAGEPPTPPGVPPGSSFYKVDPKTGKNVWRMPNGKLMREED